MQNSREKIYTYQSSAIVPSCIWYIQYHASHNDCIYLRHFKYILNIFWLHNPWTVKLHRVRKINVYVCHLFKKKKIQHKDMCKFLDSTNFHIIKPLTEPENCVFWFCLNLLCFWSHSPTDLERLALQIQHQLSLRSPCSYLFINLAIILLITYVTQS